MAAMKTSRRDFLSTVAASVPTLLSFRWNALDALGSHGPKLDCAILDLQSHCVLRESLHGYQAAFGDERSYFSDAIPDFRFRCGMIIVPGLGRIEPTLAQALSDLLKKGTHLLLESGASFLTTAEFAEHGPDILSRRGDGFDERGHQTAFPAEIFVAECLEFGRRGETREFVEEFCANSCDVGVGHRKNQG